MQAGEGLSFRGTKLPEPQIGFLQSRRLHLLKAVFPSTNNKEKERVERASENWKRPTYERREWVNFANSA
jgi:hypothetical protein